MRIFLFFCAPKQLTSSPGTKLAIHAWEVKPGVKKDRVNCEHSQYHHLPDRGPALTVEWLVGWVSTAPWYPFLHSLPWTPYPGKFYGITINRTRSQQASLSPWHSHTTHTPKKFRITGRTTKRHRRHEVFRTFRLYGSSVTLRASGCFPWGQREASAGSWEQARCKPPVELYFFLEIFKYSI